MQQEPFESTQQPVPLCVEPAPFDISQHGLLDRECDAGSRHRSSANSHVSRDVSPSSVSSTRLGTKNAISDDELRRLSLNGGPTEAHRQPVPGQRVSDHENAFTAPGLKVTRSSDALGGSRLTELPNEILTNILSHLHPDSHAVVALLSKRFYALVTSSHAWRMAFMQHFPGHTRLQSRVAPRVYPLVGFTMDAVPSDIRYFCRLKPLATWRNEYSYRTHLIRSLARGKPGTGLRGIGSSSGIGKSSRRGNAVLTFNSKLPWQVTNMHVLFSNDKKPPRAVQGAGALGVATMCDPMIGKIEKWGLEDPYSCALLEEIAPNVIPYGLGDGSVAVPNVMDVSQRYGTICGEGFPGGRAHFRSSNEFRGSYLIDTVDGTEPYLDIPEIPEMSDAVCSVWIAKSPDVPTTTQFMCGMLTGSALGVVTAYALGCDNSTQHANGDMTARWVLSPGVPIISLKVDDKYNSKRKSRGRIWAVALNALGEAFYLTEVPMASFHENSRARRPWLAGRTAHWHLLKTSKRVVICDDLDQNIAGKTRTPGPSSDHDFLSQELLAQWARGAEELFACRPAYFREAYEGWDMQRRLEVDFANDDGKSTGESIFIIDCGVAGEKGAVIRRYLRCRGTPSMHSGVRQTRSVDDSAPLPVEAQSSIFGSDALAQGEQSCSPNSPPILQDPFASHDVWDMVVFDCNSHKPADEAKAIITASCLDDSSQSLTTLSEDPMCLNKDITPEATGSRAAEPVSLHDIPGRRARLLVVGINQGAVLAWNARESAAQGVVHPVCSIQTVSPRISCVAASALYIVHGGSDGLVQAWDPLVSTFEPIRTLNPRYNGRPPRHMVAMNPMLPQGDLTSVGAISLDPDPTVLRGVVSIGPFLRYWAYSSSGNVATRKRRIKHSDVHGRIVSRRSGGKVSGYIAAEEAEMRRENEARTRERVRLRNRFGLGNLGDLTEEEALLYAQMVSEEAYQQEEHRRASDSAANASLDSASSISEKTTDTISDPSPTDASPSSRAGAAVASDKDDDHGETDFEQQLQRAMRLSLLDAHTNDAGRSPHGHSSAEHDFPIRFKPRAMRKAEARGLASSSSPLPSGRVCTEGSSLPPTAVDDADFALALTLSLQEQDPASTQGDVEEPSVPAEDFPPLVAKGLDKGKGRQMW